MMTWARTLRRVVGLGAPAAGDADVQRAADEADRLFRSGGMANDADDFAGLQAADPTAGLEQGLYE